MARARPEWPPATERISHLERAALHQQAHDGPAAGIQPRLDHDAGRLGVRVGLEFLDVGEGDDGLEQLLEVLARLGGDVGELRSPPQSAG